MRYLLTIGLLFFSFFEIYAQFTLTNGSRVLEFGGAFSTYYNYRFYPAGNNNFKKIGLGFAMLN